MGLFSGSLQNEELVVVFHIGSSSVSGALLWIRNTGVPKIIYSVREPIAPMDEINVNDFLSQAMKAFDFVAGKIATSRNGAPARIFCSLASPWYISQNRVIKMEKNTPFIFSTKLADSLIKKEIELFEKDHLSQYIESGNRVRPIELKNIKTLLNGYELTDAANQKARELEMTLFISISSEEVLSQVENITRAHFHRSEVKFFSFLMASFTVVRDMYVHQEDFLLVDIGGEVTDISMVKKNLLRESVSYPIGRNFLIRGLAGALNISLEEAQGFFSLYKDGHAEASLKKKMDPIITKLKTEWLTKFQSSLANLSNDISVPASIFITIDKEFADFFGEVIRTEQFNQYTLTESKFQIIFLDTERLHGVALFEDKAIRDNFLIMDAIYINRFLAQR